MRSSFDWSDNVGDFFFSGLTINSAGSLAILCVILATIAIIYESMKIHSAKVRARAARERQRASSCAPSETANLIATEPPHAQMKFTKRFFRLLSEASVFFLHNSLAYGLMLSVMMFNGYIFITVILSMGLGYFLFGHISMKINMENMQARTTNVICSPVCPDESSTSNTGTATGSNHCAGQMSPSTSSQMQNATNFGRIQETAGPSTITDSCRL